jgi:hypothetical protein
VGTAGSAGAGAGAAGDPARSNGRLPASELAGVGDGERMYVPAAKAFGRMDAAATAAGHDLHVDRRATGRTRSSLRSTRRT